MFLICLDRCSTCHVSSLQSGFALHVSPPQELRSKVSSSHGFKPWLQQGCSHGCCVPAHPCCVLEKGVFCYLLSSLCLQTVPHLCRLLPRCSGCGRLPVVPQGSRERWTLQGKLPPRVSKATQASKNEIFVVPGGLRQVEINTEVTFLAAIQRQQRLIQHKTLWSWPS